MRRAWLRAISCLTLLLLFSARGWAQTAARKALAQEPEVQQVLKASGSFQEQQAIPKNRADAPSAGQTLIQGFALLAAQKNLIGELKDRLELQAEACNFCPEKQNELGELLREQVAQQVAAAAIFAQAGQLSGSSTKGLSEVYGMGSDDRWTDELHALNEMGGFRATYCRNANQIRPPFCSLRYDDDTMHTQATLHRQVWSKCFTENDWVAVDGRRKAYEACMQEKDFVTQTCQLLGMTHDQRCRRMVKIDGNDVLAIRHYHPDYAVIRNR